MTERDALLAAVCEQPDDDTPRLVFADWLQEHGEEERAEFIRLQIELARGAKGKKQASLIKREQEWLAAHREAWEAPFRGVEVSGSFRRFVFNVHFRRGFVWGIDINDEDRRFEGSAAALFRLAPIERINFFHKGSHEDLTRCRELLRVKELSIDRAGFETEEIEVLLRSKFLANVTRLELIADDDNGHLAGRNRTPGPGEDVAVAAVPRPVAQLVRPVRTRRQHLGNHLHRGKTGRATGISLPARNVS